MIQAVALLAGMAFIAALYWAERDGRGGVSHALWIPWIWILTLCSRSPMAWFDTAPSGSTTARYTEGNLLETVLYAGLILAALLVLNFRAQKLKSLLRANGPLLLFCFFCALSLLWTEDPLLALKRWIKGMGTLSMILILLTEEAPLQAIKRLLAGTATLLLPLSAVLILFFPGIGTRYDSIMHITYYIGVTTQKNELGMCCLFCGIGAFWALQCAYADRTTPHRERQRAAYAILIVLAFVLIKVCDSMTSFSALTLACAVLFLLPRLHHRSGAHWLVCGVIALAAFASLLDSSGWLLQLLGRNASLTGRTDIWRAVLLLHTNPLLGTGFESFWTDERIERVWEIIGYKGIAEAHNGYLETYINLGWAGVAMLAMLIVSGYRNAMRSLGENASLGRLKLALFASSLIFNLSESGFRMMSAVWVAFLLASVQSLPMSATDGTHAATPPTDEAMRVLY
jgi:exopolysaccharide production protein ExoQ